MCEALRRLMREDLEAAEYRGRVEGEAEGEAKGKIKGKLAMLLELVKDNVLSVKEAAKRANLTEAEFIEKLMSNSLN